MTVADRDNLTPFNCTDMWHPNQKDRGDGRCFYCGRELRRVAVFLYGVSHLWLHAECAEKIGTMLIKDAFNAASIENDYPASRGTVPSLGRR